MNEREIIDTLKAEKQTIGSALTGKGGETEWTNRNLTCTLTAI